MMPVIDQRSGPVRLDKITSESEHSESGTASPLFSKACRVTLSLTRPTVVHDLNIEQQTPDNH